MARACSFAVMAMASLLPTTRRMRRRQAERLVPRSCQPDTSDLPVLHLPEDGCLDLAMV